jgi:hypothetical protein
MNRFVLCCALQYIFFLFSVFLAKGSGIYLDAFVLERKHQLYKQVAAKNSRLSSFSTDVLLQMSFIQAEELCSDDRVSITKATCQGDGHDVSRELFCLEEVKTYASILTPSLKITHNNVLILADNKAARVEACLSLDGVATLLLFVYSLSSISHSYIRRWTPIAQHWVADVEDLEFSIPQFHRYEADLLITLG